MRNKILKNICWAMVFILFISWSGIPQNAAYAQKTARLNEEERKKAVEKLEKLFDALEEAAKEIPRDTFDPQAIVDKVGKDPIKLFEWVRDNTYLVPYRGSLRGPIGVLMDRLGNSLDRALLLHELLTIAGHKARLVQGSLSKKQAEKVLKEARPIPLGGAIPAEVTPRENVEQLMARYAEKYGLNPTELKRVGQKIILGQQHMAEEVAQRVDEQTKSILALIGEIPDIRATERAKAVKELQDHWWVQWKVESSWIDLDPNLPVAKSGDSLSNEENTKQPAELDENHLHLVTIRIIIERCEEGKLKEEKVLEHTLRPSKLFGKQIIFRHIPMNWPKNLNLFTAKNSIERLKDTILEEKEWLPIIGVGSEQIWQSSFTDAGHINKVPGEEPTSEVGKGVRGVFSMFSPAEEESIKESHLTAEWIEYEIRAAGELSATIRRQIFDLIGPAARHDPEMAALTIARGQRLERGFALLSETYILALACQLSQELLRYLCATAAFEYREAVSSSRQDRAELSPGVLRKVALLPEPMYSMAFFRWMYARLRRSVYLSRPNIFSYHIGLEINTEQRPTVFFGFDVVENYVAVRPDAEVDPFQVRLEQGVIDTNIEALLIPGWAKVRNTAEIFATRTAEGTEWLNIKGSNDAHWNDLKLLRDVRSLIQEDLEAGFVVLIPEDGFSQTGQNVTGWWRVDPKTGQTLGIGDRGWGTSMLERVIKDIKIGFAVYLWCRIGQEIFGEEDIGVCVAGGLLVVIGGMPEKAREALAYAVAGFLGGAAWD